MEVIHLNAEGLKKYCEVYGNTIYNVSSDFKGIPEAWKMDTPEGIAEVIFFLQKFSIILIELKQFYCLLGIFLVTDLLLVIENEIEDT